MRTFRPTLATPGRLTRLSVVLDTRNAPDRLREVAKMCERVGVDALWVGDHPASVDGHPRLEAWTTLVLAGLSTSRTRMGVMLDASLRRPTILAAMAGTLDAAVGGRLEIGFTPFEADRGEEYATIVRRLLAGETVRGTESHQAWEAKLGVASPQSGGPPLSVEATSARGVGAAVRVADDIVIPATAPEDLRAAVEGARAACEAAGRDPGSLGIAVELPVSIGRTSAEAWARANAEPLFSEGRHPARVGIFGTLEQCQDRVIELAHMGVTDLRCVLPNAGDIPDVLAQLTAMVVGTADVLSPNAPRSRAPDPPEGWGGRARRV